MTLSRCPRSGNRYCANDGGNIQPRAVRGKDGNQLYPACRDPPGSIRHAVAGGGPDTPVRHGHGFDAGWFIANAHGPALLRKMSSLTFAAISAMPKGFWIKCMPSSSTS